MPSIGILLSLFLTSAEYSIAEASACEQELLPAVTPFADGAACLTTGLGECREAGWKLVITTGRSRYSFARAAVWQTPQDIGETAEQEGELTRDVQL